MGQPLGAWLHSARRRCATWLAPSLCVAAIYWAKLDKMYYANTLVDCLDIGLDCTPLEREVSRPIAERDLPTERILAAEAYEVFEEWKQTPAFKF